MSEKPSAVVLLAQGSEEIEAVIKRLEAYSAADLYESNKAIMKLVSDVRGLGLMQAIDILDNGKSSSELIIPLKRCISFSIYLSG